LYIAIKTNNVIYAFQTIIPNQLWAYRKLFRSFFILIDSKKGFPLWFLDSRIDEVKNPYAYEICKYKNPPIRQVGFDRFGFLSCYFQP